MPDREHVHVPRMTLDEWHAQRRDAERAIRRLTNDPRELAAQLTGELARRGFLGVEVGPVSKQPSWVRVGIHRPDRLCYLLLDEEPGMILSRGENGWQPYDHDRALAHLMGEA